jgi:acyl-CoA synthetase (AMP-forming)/AMP-acid ligase II
MIDAAMKAASMAELLSIRASESPERLAFTFLSDGEEIGEVYSYARLDREARAVALALSKTGQPGDRVLLLFAPGLAFLSGFFGCQYAGMIPIPAYPPRPDRLLKSWQILNNLIADCTPRIVLADRVIESFLPRDLSVPRLVFEEIDLTQADQWKRPAYDPQDLAIIQYTSGSTSSPRGVMIAHRNLMHNERMLFDSLEHYRHLGSGVCWLPPYHDMGLIGGLLQVVFRGASCTVMSPLAFLQDPYRWLAALSKTRADTSGGPNFAYNFCVDRISEEQKKTLDLSNWTVAGIGSETIDPKTIERFSEAFASCGFRPEAFYPGYGLAESTLMVTGGYRASAPTIRSFSLDSLESGSPIETHEGETKRMVGCGFSWMGQEVWIVEPDTHQRMPIGKIGEIWVRGESVGLGYWNRPDESEFSFHARTADGEGPFLRTGDLGFMHDGELYVTGRIKDVVIVRGRNHHPQDIEETVQGVHESLRKGNGGVFDYEQEGRAGIVVVQEIDRRGRKLDPAELISDIRQSIAEKHDLMVLEVCLIDSGTIPKTSSGKVRRHACKVEFEAGTLKIWKGAIK